MARGKRYSQLEQARTVKRARLSDEHSTASHSGTTIATNPPTLSPLRPSDSTSSLIRPTLTPWTQSLYQPSHSLTPWTQSLYQPSHPGPSGSEHSDYPFNVSSPEPSDSELDYSSPVSSDSESSGSPDTVECASEIFDKYSQEWISTLKQRKSSRFSYVCDEYSRVIFQLHCNQRSVIIPANVVRKSEKTVCKWQTNLIANKGHIQQPQQGRYQRSAVWFDDTLHQKVKEYIQVNANVKGWSNLTVAHLQRWVNDCLLPVSTLPPRFPRHVSWESNRKGMHKLGYHVLKLTREYLWMATNVRM